ncbi:MAG TPA: 30S ribosomal protein S19 [Candidatus Altiarchaeales archaeon]|nr:30S ribosomal protein S19 [Candidatus Altiarchaeales archaeon]
MAKKEFTYKGKTLEELQKLGQEDLMKTLPSRMRRTLKRGLTEEHKKLREKILKSKESGKPVKTHCREMPILPDMVGAKIMLYDGKEFKPIDLTTDMIGHYVGEFAMPRKQVKHSSPGVGATRSSLFVPIK